MSYINQINIQKFVRIKEQLRIINDNNGPALIINQTGNENILDIQQNSNTVFYIENEGNVGIGTNNPDTKLDVNGVIKGDGSQITNLNYDNITNQPALDDVSDTNFDNKFSYKSTNDLIEGINLYYTEERVNQNILSKNLISLTEENLNSNQLVYYDGESWYNLKIDSRSLEITTDRVLRVIGGTSSGNLNQVIYENETTTTVTSNLEKPIVLKTDMSEERMYPPTRNLTANTDTITGQSYGNGVYITSASSEYNVSGQFLGAYTAFTGSSHTAGWHSAGAYYNASGEYISGSVSPETIDGSFRGEWLKIKLPVYINLTKYGLEQRYGATVTEERAPGEFKIYGSKDDTTWYELVSKTDRTQITYNASYIFEESVTTQGEYQYFVIVINKLLGNQQELNLNEWYIYGKENFDTVDGLIAHYKFDATPSNGATLTNYGSLGSSYDATIYVANNLLTRETGVISEYRYYWGVNSDANYDNYINIPGGLYTNLNTSSGFTISFWKLDTTFYNEVILRLDNGGDNHNDRLLEVRLPHNSTTLIVDIHQPGTTTQERTSVSYTHDNQYSNWVIVKEVSGSNMTMKIYRNNSLLKSGTHTNITWGTIATPRFNLGQKTDDFYIEDLRIFDRALSAAEVEKLYLEGSDRGLIAHYKFDGDLTDSSGNNNHLEAVVGGHTYPDGVYDEAVLFASDTTTELRTINNFQQITHNTSFSVSTWVKLTNSNRNFIFGWGNDSTGASVGLTVESSGKILNYTWGGSNLETTNTFTDTSRYYFIVLTRTAGSQKIYVDGVLENSFTNTDTFDTGTSKLHIGYTNHHAHYSANYLDDFRIYDRALSAAEIEKLYYAQYIQKGQITDSTDEYISFRYNANNAEIKWEMEWYIDTSSPWGLQEAVNWSDDITISANSTTYTSRIPTQTELVDWLSNSEQTSFPLSGSEWAFVKRDTDNNYRMVQLGNGDGVFAYKAHHTYSPYENLSLESDGAMGDSDAWSGYHFRLVPKPKTEYTINFPEETECEILLLDDTNYNHLETPLESLTGTYTIKVGVSESSISNSTYNKTTSGGTSISSGYSTDITGTNKIYSSKEVIIKYATTKESTVTTTGASNPILSSLSSLTPEINTLLYFNTSNTVNYLDVDTNSLQITGDYKLKVVDNKYLEITDGINRLSENELELSKHLIPESNAIYDIGSIEKKIRHIFISDNSLWVGDDNKISLQDGKMRIKKRKKTVIPSRLKQLDPTINETKILSSLNKGNLKDLNLKDWNTYLKNNHQEENLIATDLFENDDDYELDAATDAWLASTSNNIIIDDSYSNIGIGKLYPTKKLDVNGDINMSGSIYLNNELISTTNINEGINKYYSEERVDSNIANKKLISFNSTAIDKDILYYRNGNWNGLKLDETTLEITTDNKLKVIGGGSGTQVLIQNESDTIISNLEKPIIDNNSNFVTDGLIAHYKFDDNTNVGLDSSGNGYNLTTKTGTPQTSTTEYVFKNSVYLLNSSLKTTSFTLHNKPFCISVWVKRTTSSNQYLIHQQKANLNNQNLHIVHMTNNKWRFGFWSDDLDSAVAYDDLNKWVHLVFQIDNTRNKELWRNGELNGSNTAAAFLNVDNSDIVLGENNGGGEYINAYIDDLRIYDRALSAAEIEKLYNEQYIQKSQITDSTDEVVSFKYNENNNNGSGQTEYTINFPEETECDILLLDDTNYKHLETPLETLNGTYTIKVGILESSISKSGYIKTTATGGTAISSGYSTDIKGASQTYSNKEVIIRYKTQIVTTVTRSDPILSSLSSLTPELNSLLYFNTSNSINYLELDPTTLEITTDNKLKVIGGGGGTQVLIQNESDTITSNLEKPIIDNNSNLVTDGLIAHYKFDTINEISGYIFKDETSNNYHLTNGGSNNPSLETGESVFGNSANFINSSDQYVETTGINLGRKSFAISVWLKLTGQGFFISQGATMGNGNQLHIGIRNNMWCFHNWGYAVESAANYASDVNGDWVHLCFVNDRIGSNNNTKYIYRNNVLIKTSTSQVDFDNDDSDPLRIGAYSNATTEAYQGYLDDLRIYDRVLSAAEIEKLYNAQYITKSLITDSKDEVVSFKYNPNNNNGSGQTEYTINFPEETECDILIVAGGGGGGNNGQGGGGGAGALIYVENKILNGNYQIKVGNGGVNTIPWTNNYGENGYDSQISKNSQTLYLAKGGGGGGTWNATNYNAQNGGSGGGGAGNDTGANIVSTNIIDSNSVSTTNSQYDNTNYDGDLGINSVNDTGCFGNKGGDEVAGGSASWGAGGGGAGSVGGPSIESTPRQAGNGGNGKKYSITGTEKYYAGGGGGGVRSYGTEFTASVILGQGGLGGGGNGAGGYAGNNSTTLDENGYDAEPHTGGGGGGVGAVTASNFKGGNGASGIVIIRYKTQIVTTVTRIDPKLSSLSSLTPEVNSLLYFNTLNSINYLELDPTSLEITSDNKLKIIDNLLNKIENLESNLSILQNRIDVLEST